METSKVKLRWLVMGDGWWYEMMAETEEFEMLVVVK